MNDDVPQSWYPRVAFLPLRKEQEEMLRRARAQRSETADDNDNDSKTGRTVVCSACGESGHNKRSCKDEAQTKSKSDDTVRTTAAKASARTVICSKCSGVGHNKRTCEQS